MFWRLFFSLIIASTAVVGFVVAGVGLVHYIHQFIGPYYSIGEKLLVSFSSLAFICMIIAWVASYLWKMLDESTY